MKTAIFILAILFISCSSTSTKDFHHAKSDTTITTILYMNSSVEARVDQAYRIIKDTFAFDTVDSETAKKIWKRDTSYFPPVWVPVKDSAGKVIKDSAGNDKREMTFQLIQNKNWVLQDYNKRIF